MHHLDATSKGRHGLSVAGSVMPTYEEDKRFIYFVPEGVDIRDSVGTSLGERVLRSGIMKPVTLPLSDIISQLENDPIKDKFFELWSRETGLDLVSTIFAAGGGQRVAETRSGNVPPASAYRGTRANQPFHRDKDANKRIKNHLPLQPGDALWLFHRFLTETYPNGGEIDAADPSQLPESPSVWIKLKVFCQKPKYSNHPYLLSVNTLADIAILPGNTSASNGALKLVLDILRPPVSARKFRVSYRGRQIWKKIFTVSANAPAGVLPVLEHPVFASSEEILEEVDGEQDIGHGDQLIGQVAVFLYRQHAS